ncbi:hypothetical protein BJ508DRAFT_306310 [Ascobolus immersus RN42]|uniref:Uncharacterized protein n=1 Tax=Ascobolus immersus RN42 TaxID=1160509 RepID=A0A3N4IAJ7_ASCIM|nr:hypothetical protein BJ508DRAFT_306310 [Ascobolus immersus RN42]
MLPPLRFFFLLMHGVLLFSNVLPVLAPDPGTPRAFSYETSDTTSGHGNVLFNHVTASEAVSFETCSDQINMMVYAPNESKGRRLASPKLKKNCQCWYSVQPLDHLDASDRRTINVAVAVIPPFSGIVEGSASWMGFFYFDFGGPGAISIVDGWSNLFWIQRLMPNFTIVFRDARGAGASGPQSNCFASMWEERLHKGTMTEGVGSMLTGGTEAAERLKAKWVAFAETCTKRLGGKNGVLRHLGLAAHARDLLNIHTALCRHYNVDLDTDAGRLNFWGVSWGGSLGHALAAMAPESLGRLVLDYVDAAFASLGHMCDDAGAACKLANRFKDTYTDVWNYLFFNYQPTVEAQYRVLSFVRLGHAVLYNPNLQLRKYIDQLLSFGEQLKQVRDGLLHPKNFLSFSTFDKKDHASQVASKGETDWMLPNGEIGYASQVIKCVDTDRFGLEDVSAAGIESAFAKAYEISKIGSDNQVASWLSCLGFSSADKAKEKIPAPTSPVRTRFPVLITGLKRDPIAPQRSAKGEPYGIRHYERAFYLEIDFTGHGVASAIPWDSRYEEVLGRYIQKGVVPNEEVCKTLANPFHELFERAEPSTIQNERMPDRTSWAAWYLRYSAGQKSWLRYCADHC